MRAIMQVPDGLRQVRFDAAATGLLHLHDRRPEQVPQQCRQRESDQVPNHPGSSVNTSRTRSLGASATCCSRSAATPRYGVVSIALYLPLRQFQQLGQVFLRQLAHDARLDQGRADADDRLGFERRDLALAQGIALGIFGLQVAEAAAQAGAHRLRGLRGQALRIGPCASGTARA
ncbi:MAG: hypothetical protein H7306_24180 [Bacteriovorax sp.]|nr:hypothetical protein [Rhizobacter sp.]